MYHRDYMISKLNFIEFTWEKKSILQLIEQKNRFFC